MVVWNSMLLENYYHALGCCEATCSFHNALFFKYSAKILSASLIAFK